MLVVMFFGMHFTVILEALDWWHEYRTCGYPRAARRDFICALICTLFFDGVLVAAYMS